MTLIIDGEWTQDMPLDAECVRSAARKFSSATIQLDALTFDAGRYSEPSAEYLEWSSR